jgi:hypothetical protein
MKIVKRYLEFINEGKEKWIQKINMKGGTLHKKLGVPEDEKIPVSKLKVKDTDSPKLKKEKILAQTLKKINK